VRLRHDLWRLRGCLPTLLAPRLIAAARVGAPCEHCYTEGDGCGGIKSVRAWVGERADSVLVQLDPRCFVEVPA
jgi:hypothetical protein